MIQDLVRGAGFFWRGFGMLGRPRIRVFAFLPIVLGVFVLAAAIWLAATFFSDLVASLEGSVPEWLAWLSWILWAVFVAGAGLLIMFGFVIVTAAIASPFNGLLAEAVEVQVTGRKPPSSSWMHLLRNLPRTLVQETKKLLYFFLWAIPFLLLFLVPGANLAAPFLWVVFSSWIFALDFCDYAMDNAGLDFNEIRRRLRARPAVAMGFGGMIFLAAAIPVFNLLVVPAAVIGGTLLWIEEL